MDQVLSNQIGAGYADDDPVPMRFDVSGALWTRDYYVSSVLGIIGSPYSGSPSSEVGNFLRIGGRNLSTGLFQSASIGGGGGVNVEVVNTPTVATDLGDTLTGLASAGAGANANSLGVDLQFLNGISVASVGFGSNVGFPVGGGISHDSPASTIPPVLIGGHASSGSPTAVNADNDAVRAWFLRNGAQVVSLGTSTGLLTSDTTNGLKVYLGGADAALADNMTNPTTTVVGSMGMVWGAVSGTRWARLLGINQLVGAGGTGGDGIPSAGLAAKYDESPASITDGNWGELRMNANRVLMISGDVRLTSSLIGIDTELPTAAALADNTATPTVPAVGAFGMMYDGANWDMLRGTSTDGLLVNLGTNNDVDTELPAAATIAADGVAPTVPGLAAYGFIKTPGANTWDRTYSVINAANTTGTGITAAGNMAQYDDTSPQIVTENQFGNMRMSLSGVLYTGGSIQHGFPDAGNPNKMGMRAVNHKTAPVEVHPNDVTNWYANRSGVPFVIGGHPDIITSGCYIADIDNAQTNRALLAYPTNYKIVVTEIEAMCDKANTVDVGVYAGFHSTTTPTGLGQLFRHPGIAAGSGIVKGTGAGILGIGASGDKLLMTCEDPTTGGINVAFSYYVINES